MKCHSAFEETTLLPHRFLARKNNLDKHFEASFCTSAKTVSSCAPGVLPSRCFTTEVLPGSSLLPVHRHSATGEQAGQERKSSDKL